jgi:hypothetical protein
MFVSHEGTVGILVDNYYTDYTMPIDVTLELRRVARSSYVLSVSFSLDEDRLASILRKVKGLPARYDIEQIVRDLPDYEHATIIVSREGSDKDAKIDTSILSVRPSSRKLVLLVEIYAKA